MSGWQMSDVLSTAHYLAKGSRGADAIAAARLGLLLEPVTDPRPMLRTATREAVRTAAATSVLAELASDLFADGERDALTDEQEAVLRSVVEREPRALVLQRLVELVEQHVAQIVRGVARDEVVPTVVGEHGHDDSPSVGRSEGGTSAVVGAGDAAASSAGVPTVGVPTDAPAEASPSPAGASVVPVCLLREREEQRGQLRTDLYAIVRAAGGLHTDELAERLLEAGWRRS